MQKRDAAIERLKQQIDQYVDLLINLHHIWNVLDVHRKNKKQLHKSATAWNYL